MLRFHPLAFRSCLSLFSFASVLLIASIYGDWGEGGSLKWGAAGLAGATHLAFLRVAPARQPKSWRHGLSAVVVGSAGCAILRGLLSFFAACVVLFINPGEAVGLEFDFGAGFGLLALLLIWPASFLAHLLVWALFRRVPIRGQSPGMTRP